MLKKVSTWLAAIVLILVLAACGNNNDDEYEARYIDLGEYLEENRERLIASIATEGEEVQIELSDGEMNKYIFTILVADIELNNENRTLHSFAFEASFINMEELFVGIAKEIRDATRHDYFAIRVVFIDVNGEEIASHIFSTLTLEILEINDDEED